MTNGKAIFAEVDGGAYDWLSQTRKRVEDQAEIVRALRPGSKAHRTATNILFLYEDCLEALDETAKMLTALRRAKAASHIVGE